MVLAGTAVIHTLVHLTGGVFVLSQSKFLLFQSLLLLARNNHLSQRWLKGTNVFLLCLGDYQIEQLKLEVNRKESDMQALQTKLETLTNQNSDCKQHIEVLKESLSAKEQRANTLQTEVSTNSHVHTYTKRYTKRTDVDTRCDALHCHGFLETTLTDAHSPKWITVLCYDTFQPSVLLQELMCDSIRYERFLFYSSLVFLCFANILKTCSCILGPVEQTCCFSCWHVCWWWRPTRMQWQL